MKGRCESNCGRNEVYPATFGNEEKNGYDDDDNADDRMSSLKWHFLADVHTVHNVSLHKARLSHCYNMSLAGKSGFEVDIL